MPKTSAKELATLSENSSKAVTLNKQTGELEQVLTAQGFTELDVDSVASEDEIVFLPGFPLQYKSNGKDGNFYIGDEAQGETLLMEVVRVRAFTAAIFNYPLQEWLEVFFVNKDNALAHCLFKGNETIRAFKNYALKLRGEKKPLLSVVTMAASQERSGKDANGRPTTYFTFSFSGQDNGSERVAELREFVSENAASIHCQEIDDLVARSTEY